MRDYFSKNRTFVDLIPTNLRNETNVSLMQNLFDRFLTKEESVPMFGYVGKNSVGDPIQRLPQMNLDRELNQLVSTYVFRTGSKTHYFTPHDILLTLGNMGVADPKEWLKATGNNYIPPIDINKFVNFYEYFWVANAMKSAPEMAWNQSNSPEYYTIAKPSVSSQKKMNVRCATTEMIALTGSGFYDVDFSVEFTSDRELTVTAIGNTFGMESGISQSFTLSELPTNFNTEVISDTINFVSGNTVLLSLVFTRELMVEDTTYYQTFYAGDKFHIDCKFIDTAYFVSFTGGQSDIRRGGISSVRTLSQFQIIDGVQVREGDRVLVINGSNQGIFEVVRGDWVKTTDNTSQSGDYLYCQNGLENGGFVFSFTDGQWRKTSDTSPVTNDWQENNFWVHKSVFDSAHPFDLSKVEQARRPIIEYWDGLELNSRFGDYQYTQQKHTFNQIPLFNIYNYDGTSSGLTSSLFYYVEDPRSEIDLLLQKRVKMTSSEDFVFEHGLTFDGRLQFYKQNGQLKTIWHAGYNGSVVVRQSFSGKGDGTLQISAKADQQQQILSFTYVSANTFEIRSSKYGDVVSTFTTGAFDTPIASGSITVGSTPFSIGDVFLVMISGQEKTREMVIPDGKEVGVFENGGIKFPRMFSHNPLNENDGEIREGSMYGHLRSVINNQLSNEFDYAFGGSIKSWNAPMSLLYSMSMQKDINPLELIDFAKREYENALNNVNEVYFTNIIKYLLESKNLSNGIDVPHLTDFVIAIISKDTKSKTIFVDSTSGVPGFPISLAKMGLIPRHTPEIIFDGEVSTWFIKHHDGHLNPVFENDSEFQQLLFEKRVKAVYPGIVSDYQLNAPTPVKGAIWRSIVNRQNVIKVFCVEVSSASQPELRNADGSIKWDTGDVWHQQGTNKIYRFDAVSAKWDLTTESHSQFWKIVDFAELLNQVILEVETRLYENIDQFKPTLLNPSEWQDLPFVDELQSELASWAFRNKLDPTANQFNQKNAFSWNYTRATIPGIPSPKARWFDVIKQHQTLNSGVIPTERPDLYPWKLLGFNAKPIGWDAQYASAVGSNPSFASTFSAKVVETNRNSQNYGTRIIDNVMVKAGDIVLVHSNLVASRNGIWKVTNDLWEPVQVATSAKITISTGSTLAGSEWVFSNGEFHQIRMWSTQMWETIKAQRPLLKISVNRYNDRLLPPYVNQNISVAEDAIINTVPSGITLPFVFGDKSQVENLWMKSIEFGYSLVKALFRHDPISFYTSAWGLDFITVAGVQMELNSVSPFSVKRMHKHGDTLEFSDRSSNLTVGSVNTTNDEVVELTMVGVFDSRQVFKLTVSGVETAYFAEGQEFSIDLQNVQISGLKIEDGGIPFHIGDKFVVKTTGETTSISVWFEHQKFVIQNGFGQLFGQALRSFGVDAQIGYASAALTDWEPQLGYRVGGYMDDDCIVSTSLETLDSNVYQLASKKTANFNSSWITALRVTTIQVGANSKKVQNGYIPNDQGDDWVFRIEGYNPNNMELNFYTFNKNGLFNTFNAIEKAHTPIDWKQFIEPNELQTVTLPVTIIGIQNVLNFVFGYELWLKEQGWNFDKKEERNADFNGRYLDFQYLLEKFIDGVYASGDVGRGGILNPIAGGIWFDHPQGLLSSFVCEGLFNPQTHGAAYDTFGLRIQPQDMQIYRQKEQSLIAANTPIFSIHAEVDAYEHLMIFNRFIRPSDESGVLYDPFQGSIVSFIKFNGKRQASQTLRPEVGGYILQNDKLVPNLESNIQDLGNMYDSNYAFDNKQMTEHAMALYGFNKKSYMANMDYTDKTQVNFWRGMVHMKGTNMSFDAFKNGNRFDDARLDEYWAYKIAEYGDARTKIKPEIVLRDSDCQQQFTKMTLDGQFDENFIRIDTDDEARWFESADVGSIKQFNSKVVKVEEFEISQQDIDNSTIFQFKNSGDFVAFSSNLTKISHTCFVANAVGPATVTYSSVDADTHSPFMLINFDKRENVQTIPVWHPIHGAHNPNALAAIDVTSNKNPALYNYSTIIAGNSNFDAYRKWGKNEVGLVWFDTSKLNYLPYNDDTQYDQISQRLNRWGSLSEFGEINVAEWVESDVSPSEYLELSKSSNNDIKTDGIPYNPKTYQRSRIWSIYPIAWSQAGSPIESAHPSFNGAFNSAINFRSNGMVSLETGTFDGLGVNVGMRLGAWMDNLEYTGPLNEFIISDAPVSKFYVKNSLEFFGDNLEILGVPVRMNISNSVVSSQVGVMEVSFDPFNDVEETPVTNFDGTFTGQSNYTIYVSVFMNDVLVGKSVVGTASGPSGTEPDVSFIDDTPIYVQLSNGAQLEFIPSQSFIGKWSDLAEAIDQVFFDGVDVEDAIFVEAVTIDALEPSFELPFPTTLVNDDDDPRYAANNNCGWRAWSVPTQDDLDNDADFPNSIWKPYVGLPSVIPNVSMELINDAIQNGTLTLNNGVEISRYSTSWTEWSEVNSELHDVISTGGDVSISLSAKFDQSRIFVFKNGVRQFPGSFTIFGAAVLVPDTKIGDQIHVEVSKYQPTEDELEFNPDVQDDLKKQVHFKIDYEFVQNDVRSLDGGIIGKKYYFWVTGKTTTKSKLPTTTISELLKNGPTQYVVFPSTTSFAVFGLNYLVAKNDTFKLRLVNDLTLRSDPNGLDLKNTHEEWTLIRKGQRQKVPETLWNKIVDSICGADISNQELPYRSIVEYDARNNTSTIYGFGDGQVIAPREILVKTIFDTITNSKVTIEFDLTGNIDFIGSDVLDWNNPEEWFDTPENTRRTMENIWAKAKNSQINEIVFAAIEDACAYIEDMTHLIKTSRLSAYSIRIINPSPATEDFE